MAREDEIKIIAFNIWQEEGCLEGRDCEHWFRAEIIWEQKQKEKNPAKNNVTKLPFAWEARKTAAPNKRK